MKKSTLQRMLFTIPPDMMSHDALAEAAFNFYHYEHESQWFISDDILTVNMNDHVRHFDLTQLTIADLITELNSNGFIVENINENVLSYPAISLNETDSGRAGSGLSKINSTLLVMLKAYSRELRRLRKSIPEAIKQLIIPQSEGYWLDRWGSIYGIDKPTYLDDKKYAQYIPDEAFRIRVNAIAIEKAVKDITGYDIIITEPWRQVFTLDISKLSSSAKFQDGKSIGYCIIKPISYDYVPWQDIIPIIMRNKAGGVIMLDPEILYKVGALEVYEAKAWLGVRENIPKTIRFYELPNILDLMRLSTRPYILHAWSFPTSIHVTSPLSVYDATAWFSHSDIMAWHSDYSIKLIDAYRTDVAYCSGIDYLTWEQINQPWKDLHRNWMSGELSTKILYSIKDSWVSERQGFNPLLFDTKASLSFKEQLVINLNYGEISAKSYQSNINSLSAKNEFSLFNSFAKSDYSYSLNLSPSITSTHINENLVSVVSMPKITANLLFSDSSVSVYLFNQTKATSFGRSDDVKQLNINDIKAELHSATSYGSSLTLDNTKASLSGKSELSNKLDFQFITLHGRSERNITVSPALSISAKCLYNSISMISSNFNIGTPKSMGESNKTTTANCGMNVLATRSVAVSAEGPIYSWETPELKWGDFTWIDKTLPPFVLS